MSSGESCKYEREKTRTGVEAWYQALLSLGFIHNDARAMIRSFLGVRLPLCLLGVALVAWPNDVLCQELRQSFCSWPGGGNFFSSVQYATAPQILQGSVWLGRVVPSCWAPDLCRVLVDLVSNQCG